MAFTHAALGTHAAKAPSTANSACAWRGSIPPECVANWQAAALTIADAEVDRTIHLGDITFDGVNRRDEHSKAPGRSSDPPFAGPSKNDTPLLSELDQATRECHVVVAQ